MTDKEIVKALECCPLPGGCGVCPYNNGDLTDCDARICRDALHLITCQQSQIDDLYIALDDRIQKIKALEAEVERIEKLRAEASKEVERQYEQAEADILANMADGGASCHWCIDGHRSAAIREFAERLKEESEVYCSAPNGAGETVLAVSCDDIDAIVKEMTEETNNV